MPGDTRRVVRRDDESNGRRIRRGVNSERNQTLLIDFFRQNRRRARANELERARMEAEDRRRAGGVVVRNNDDGDGKKHSRST